MLMTHEKRFFEAAFSGMWLFESGDEESGWKAFINLIVVLFDSSGVPIDVVGYGNVIDWGYNSPEWRGNVLAFDVVRDFELRDVLEGKVGVDTLTEYVKPLFPLFITNCGDEYEIV
jgi:hypothetical protein